MLKVVLKTYFVDLFDWNRDDIKILWKLTNAYIQLLTLAGGGAAGGGGLF